MLEAGGQRAEVENHTRKFNGKGWATRWKRTALVYGPGRRATLKTAPHVPAASPGTAHNSTAALTGYRNNAILDARESAAS